MNQIINQTFLTSIINREMAWTILEAIANTHAPSQTVSYTRALVIRQLLPELGLKGYEFEANYAQTGNALLSMGAQPPKILFLAHADEFSYLVGTENDEGAWSLIPYCSDRTKIAYEAVALRYQPDMEDLTVVATGTINRDNSDQLPYFVPVEGAIQPGDRLIYTHPLHQTGDIGRGSLDNAAGVTACLLAALALGQVAPDAPVAFAFTDEEEGPPISNATFARGARRLLQRLALPEVCINVDGHNLSPWSGVGAGAVFTERAGQGHGGVVPPHLYAIFKDLAAEMRANGVRLVENQGYVSRSDDVACMEIMQNVLLLGYPLKDPHFNQAVPVASIADILDLAQAIVWTTVGLGGHKI